MPDPGNPIAGLYPQPNQNQPTSLLSDPLKALSALSSVQNMQIQRQQFQSQFAGGQAFQSALNPDGTIDPSRLSTALKTPAAALSAPEMVQRGLNAQGSALDNYNKNIKNGSDALGLSAQNNTALGQFLNSMTDFSDAGIAKAKVQAARQFPTIPPNILNAAFAGVSNVDPTNVKGRQQATAQFANSTQSVGAQNQPISLVDSQGRPKAVPAASFNAPTGGAVSGLSGPDKASSDAYGNATNQEMNYGQEMYPMQRALQLVKQLGPGGTGPGAEGRNNFASFVNSITPSALQGMIPGVDPTKIKDFDEFNKYVTQAAQTRAAGLGAHTDAQLATTLTANPSAHINDLAVGDVLKANIALRNMQRTQTMSAKEKGPLGFNDEASRLSGVLDPRAFLLPMLEPDQRAALSKTITSKTERDKFNKSIDMGIKSGAIDPESLNPTPTAPTTPSQ